MHPILVARRKNQAGGTAGACGAGCSGANVVIMILGNNHGHQLVIFIPGLCTFVFKGKSEKGVSCE